jgi:hypothetical protein
MKFVSSVDAGHQSSTSSGSCCASTCVLVPFRRCLGKVVSLQCQDGRIPQEARGVCLGMRFCDTKAECKKKIRLTVIMSMFISLFLLLPIPCYSTIQRLCMCLWMFVLVLHGVSLERRTPELLVSPHHSQLVFPISVKKKCSVARVRSEASAVELGNGQ